MTSCPFSNTPGRVPLAYDAPGAALAFAILNGPAALRVGKVRPELVRTSMSPFGTASVFTFNNPDSVFIAASRWFSRSAVDWPATFSDKIWSPSLPIWLKA